MYHHALGVFGELLNLTMKSDHCLFPPALKACAGIDDVSLGTLVLYGG